MNEIVISTRTKHLSLEECKDFDFAAAVADPSFHQIVKRQTAGENPIPIIAVQFVTAQPVAEPSSGSGSC